MRMREDEVAVIGRTDGLPTKVDPDTGWTMARTVDYGCAWGERRGLPAEAMRAALLAEHADTWEDVDTVRLRVAMTVRAARARGAGMDRTDGLARAEGQWFWIHCGRPETAPGMDD